MRAKPIVDSLIAITILSTGLATGWAMSGAQKARADEPCAAGNRCEAVIECEGDQCVVRWTAQDGRTGEIVLSCVDGECKVVSCDPCCDTQCEEQGTAPAAAAAPAEASAPAACTGPSSCCK